MYKDQSQRMNAFGSSNSEILSLPKVKVIDNKLFYSGNGEEREVSVYDAIELIIYQDVLVPSELKDLSPDEILKKFPPKKVEPYGWTLVVESGTKLTDSEIMQLLKQHRKDYVLEHTHGDVTVWHKSNNWEKLEAEGYSPSPGRTQDGGGSFAVGLYCYDKYPGNTVFRQGEFYGHYFTCIADPSGDGKDGDFPGKSCAEILIPWDTNKIRWIGDAPVVNEEESPEWDLSQ